MEVSAQGGVCPIACWDTHTPSSCELNHRQVKNITLPQTSFAGGNNIEPLEIVYFKSILVKAKFKAFFQFRHQWGGLSSLEIVIKI